MERKIHYNQLSKEQRQRLIGCFSSESAPAPILQEQLSIKGAIFGFLCLSALGMAGLLFVFTVDFGKSYSGIQSPFWLAAYGLAFFLIFYGVVKSVQRYLMGKHFPFTPGRYLFPLEIVDARAPVLRILPMASMTDFRAVHHHTNGAYTHTELHFYFEGGAHEMFSVRGKHLAEEALDNFDGQRALFRQALEEGDMGVVAALDPFIEVRLDEAGWDKYTAEAVEVQEGPGVKDLITPLMYPAAVALICAIGASPLSWSARQYLSDGARYERALKAPLTGSYFNRAQALEDYLRGGFRFRKEVIEEQLPKAHFEAAKAKKSVSAMRDFLASFPASKYKDEANAEISRQFNEALTKFKAQASKENPQATEFMTKLLAYMEREGSPPVDVIFRPPPTDHLRSVDADMSKKFGVGADPKLVKKDPVYRRTMAPISPEFVDSKAIPREKAITGILKNGFKAIFPEDILVLEDGPRLLDSSLPTDAEGKKTIKGLRFPRPTIIVNYIVLPSGAIYTLDKDPNRVFTGIEVYFVVTMYLPESEDNLTFSVQVEPPQNFTVNYSNSLGLTTGPSTSQVYNIMAIRAFDQLATKMRDFFFDKDSDAAKKFKASPNAAPSTSRYP